MSDSDIISEFDALDFRSKETIKYSVWVYVDSNGVQAYLEEQPNTDEIWFKFYKFNHFYWKLFENECIEDMRGTMFYNFNKMKHFMIRRMICSTSIDGMIMRYDKDGFLTRESFENVMSIHPRILRALFDKVKVFPKSLKKSEEKELEKQCSILFGKGEGVTDPHPYITMYCNLVAFQDKFGMNYFDIMRLPQDVFSALKKIMVLENNFKSAKIDGAVKPSQKQGSGHSVRF